MPELLLTLLFGLLSGIVVNILADDLPYRRQPGMPAYPDGTPRPLIAWSGIGAFLTKQRTPATPQPNENRARYFEAEPRLSWRYPLTELLCIGLMLLAYYAATSQETGALQYLLWLIYMAIMALIIVIDVEHKLILFVVIIPSVMIALFDALLIPGGPNTADALIGAAIGFGVFFIMYQGGFLFTYLMGQARGQKINTVAFGYGDVMLATLSGMILGVANIILAIFITVFLGAGGAMIFLLVRAVISRRYSAFTAIPYGPYIAAATILMLLFGTQLRMAMVGY